MRVLMSGIGIAIALACMLIGYHMPQTVMPLKNEQAEFMDMLQSFALVSLVVSVCLYIYISAYDEQRRILLEQSAELKKLMYTDTLTGIANRHAYYDESSQYSKNGSDVSIATGVAAWNEHRDMNFFELEKLADSFMYQDKSKHYREAGLDRRKR